jgi:hypothetical protein
MFKILIDTCVWLDVAKDHQRQSILGVLEELVRQKQVSIILPRTVLDEFTRIFAADTVLGRISAVHSPSHNLGGLMACT